MQQAVHPLLVVLSLQLTSHSGRAEGKHRVQSLGFVSRQFFWASEQGDGVGRTYGVWSGFCCPIPIPGISQTRCSFPSIDVTNLHFSLQILFVPSSAFPGAQHASVFPADEQYLSARHALAASFVGRQHSPYPLSFASGGH
jgi:hypothetical protein